MLRALVAALLLLLASAVVVDAEVEEVEHYESLEALTLGADAVVLGRITEAKPGRVFSGCGYAEATLEVEALLAGGLPPDDRRSITVEYFGWCGPLPQLGKEIPADRGVFFLRNGGVAARIANPNVSAAEAEAEAAFWGLVILAGTVVEVNGRVHVPETLNAPFLEAHEGQDFGTFVALVASIAPPPGEQPAEAAPAGGGLPAWVGPLVLVALAVGISVVAFARGDRRAA